MRLISINNIIHNTYIILTLRQLSKYWVLNYNVLFFFCIIFVFSCGVRICRKPIILIIKHTVQQCSPVPVTNCSCKKAAVVHYTCFFFDTLFLQPGGEEGVHFLQGETLLSLLNLYSTRQNHE